MLVQAELERGEMMVKEVLAWAVLILTRVTVFMAVLTVLLYAFIGVLTVYFGWR